jgi:hypothetical protein
MVVLSSQLATRSQFVLSNEVAFSGELAFRAEQKAEQVQIKPRSGGTGKPGTEVPGK